MHNQKSLTLRWRSLWEMVTILSKLFLPRTAADSSIMGQCRRTTLASSKMQCQKSLTLCWCSFLGQTGDGVAIIFAYKCGRQFDDSSMSPRSPCIFHDARPKVVDSPLTLVFRTWSRCWHNHVLPRKAGDSSIISQGCSETLCIFNDAMPKIVDSLWTLIFRR